MNFRLKSSDFTVPTPIRKVSDTLKNAGFEAYLVGGCVRDLLLGRKPKDWDITTNATPEEIIALFPETFYENAYGTVGVVNADEEIIVQGEKDETFKVVEVTPYRLEAEYSDNRRPDAVTFSSKLEDDLKRRDFTINAIALDIPVGKSAVSQETLVDLYDGRKDLEEGTIRTVGDPVERFTEDALRLLRAVRIATELGFAIEEKTQHAIGITLALLGNISKERIRDEFSRIIMSENPMIGLEMLRRLGMVGFISKDLEGAHGIVQNKAHKYDVWEHLLRTLQHTADKKWPLHVRLAALLHDISKPETRRFADDKKEWTFYGHDVVGARRAKQILTDLKYPKKIIEQVVRLVRWHMFFSDTEKITLSAVRRLVANVGRDHIWDLMNLRVADRVGTGRPKENPYRLRKYRSMIEEALRDPITVGMLKIDGARIMEIAKIPPSPKVGHILHALLEEVLNDPTLNTVEYMEKRAAALATLSEKELAKIGEQGKQKKKEEEEKEIGEIRKKHWVE